ncbi:MAG: hypothetical protein QM652_09270 [Legionella sp.]|uniref:hypothetical protein n=1 Tax=Legionella sp. TaxID=459 RepID=UPI0039E341E6
MPEETIKRRYVAGLKNFFNLYTPLADSWQFYDNSDANLFLIASKAHTNDPIIKDRELWQLLLETSCWRLLMKRSFYN